MNPLNPQNNLKRAESYYNAMLSKDFETMASYLDDNVLFIGPLAEMQGKNAVVSAAKNLSKMLKSIDFRAKFAVGDQIMFAYDFIFPAPIGNLRASVLMGFKDNLITRIELFYDSSPLTQKRDEIFEEQNK